MHACAADVLVIRSNSRRGGEAERGSSLKEWEELGGSTSIAKRNEPKIEKRLIAVVVLVDVVVIVVILFDS